MSERDQFEAWAKRTGACSKSIGFNKCLTPGSEIYDDPILQGYWSAWQASREALKAEQASVTWQYVKGGEYIFKGAPKWATHWIKFDTSPSYWFSNGVFEGAKYVHESGKEIKIMDSPDLWRVYGERRLSPPSQPHPIGTTSQQHETLAKGE